MRGICPAGQAREEGLKRRRLKPTIFKWFESSCSSLRETHENSNFILLRIPIGIQLFEHGLQAVCMDSHRLPEILGLSETAVERLRQAGLVRIPPPTPRAKERINYSALQQTYAGLLSEGPFSKQAELARHLGVSRVWVSRVLRGVKRTVG